MFGFSSISAIEATHNSNFSMDKTPTVHSRHGANNTLYFYFEEKRKTFNTGTNPRDDIACSLRHANLIGMKRK